METYSAESQKHFNDDPLKTLVLWQFSEDQGRTWRNFADFNPKDVRYVLEFENDDNNNINTYAERDDRNELEKR